MKRAFHPRAFLSQRRNVRSGLVARTQILQTLEKQESDVRGIAGSGKLSYRVVTYHLRLLEAERVVGRKGERKPYVWRVTGVGQQRLLNSASK